MSKAAKAMWSVAIGVVVVGVLGYGIGYWFGEWPERAAYLVVIALCLNYQKYLELVIGEEMLDQLHEQRINTRDSG